ncbi:MAG: hypothetical protein LBF78_09760 [Treponema sp.]|jgi:hypothetical protein|nr:hypothetical protein [Treponema sp.]
MKKLMLLPVLLLCIAAGLSSQTSAIGANATKDPKLISVQFDTTGFPQWAKDLRRGEIIAFGSFPFAYFFTNFFYDTYRCATHGWDTRYAPWPVNSSDSVEKTQKEQVAALGIAAGGAVLIAVVDHVIERYKRNKVLEEIRRLPEGTPIIIRKPLYENVETEDRGGPVEDGSIEAAPKDETSPAPLTEPLSGAP